MFNLFSLKWLSKRNTWFQRDNPKRNCRNSKKKKSYDKQSISYWKCSKAYELYKSFGCFVRKRFWSKIEKFSYVSHFESKESDHDNDSFRFCYFPYFIDFEFQFKNEWFLRIKVFLYIFSWKQVHGFRHFFINKRFVRIICIRFC